MKGEIHPIDQHVGRQLKRLRTVRGQSQSSLGESLGVTFQQIQKYETGKNRLSASKLFEAAGILHVNLAYFFEGLDDLVEVEVESGFPFSNRQRTEVLRCFGSLPDVERRKVLAVVRSITIGFR